MLTSLVPISIRYSDWLPLLASLDSRSLWYKKLGGLQLLPQGYHSVAAASHQRSFTSGDWKRSLQDKEFLSSCKVQAHSRLQ